MIDTHAHLERLCDIDKGISKIILAGASLETSRINLTLGEKFPEKLLVAVGIHPAEINDSPAELEKIVEENYKNIVAIGECGLEFVDEVDKKKQIELFEKQIELSIKFDKPLIIHSRKASDETLEILEKYKTKGGVIHCYTGGIKRIKKVLNLGENWYFGIDGNITYEVGLEEVAKNIPKEKLILETDSPYLTPEPFRGQENNPNNVKYIYQKVAEIWGMSFEETEKIIDQNAKRLFNIV